MSGVQSAKSKENARVTVGTDPEFFLKDQKTGRYISAVGIVSGTKEEPERMPNGSYLQYDNVAVEFATEPAKDAEDLVYKIRNTFLDVYDKIPDNLDIVAEPSAKFDIDQLSTKEAMRFGCDPDFDAWRCEQNVPPETEGLLLRSCGGHIHIGHTEGDGCEFLHDLFGKINTVKVMDVFHGVLSVVLDSGATAHERRQLYGKAGCYRATDYGVEYRVLSNFWLKSPDTVRLIDSLNQDVLAYLKTYDYDTITDIDCNIELIEVIGKDKIVNTINNSDVDTAKEIIDMHVAKHMSDQTLDLLHKVMESDKETTIKEAWGLK
jgi:hypothetical protein